VTLKLRQVVQNLVGDIPDGKFYTPKEWNASVGEWNQVHPSALLVVVHGGGNLAPFFDPEGDRAVEMDGALQACGVYAELCTGWYAVINPLPVAMRGKPALRVVR